MPGYKNRTKLQEEDSRRLIEEQIDRSEVDTVFIFTDGSCRGDPGPCLLGQEESVELKKPVSRLASILLGEFVAIEIALSFIQGEVKKKRVKGVKIFCDSQSAVGLLTLGWTPTSYQGTISQIKKQIGVVEKPYCKCGEIESCKHYLMECEEVQDLRERLKVKMWQLTGEDLWTMEEFLAVTNKDEYEQEIFIINDILEEFLERSGRLTKTA